MIKAMAIFIRLTLSWLKFSCTWLRGSILPKSDRIGAICILYFLTLWVQRYNFIDLPEKMSGISVFMKRITLFSFVIDLTPYEIANVYIIYLSLCHWIIICCEYERTPC